jgi:hypothetical protein
MLEDEKWENLNSREKENEKMLDECGKYDGGRERRIFLFLVIDVV